MQALIISYISHLPKELATFLLGAIPVTELRAALPIGYRVYHLSAFWAWFFSVAGTFFSMILIVYLLDPIATFLSARMDIFKKFFDWLFEHTRKRVSHRIEEYEEWGIFILAATPIPLVGGMTGALAAFVFGIPRKKSLPLLLLGTMVSGGIVLGITLFFK